MRIKISYNSPVILTFAMISSALLIMDDQLGMNIQPSYFMVHPTMSYSDPLDYFRLFSHVFGHMDWAHLSGNFMLLLILGPMLEEKYGSINVLEMMLITATVTGILNILFFPTALMGASGIVFMFILLSSFTNFRSGEIPLTFLLIMTLYLLSEVLMSFRDDNVSQFAHILGGVIGSSFGFLMKKERKEV